MVRGPGRVLSPFTDLPPAVKDSVVTYNNNNAPNASPFGEATPYDRMTAKEKLDFWTHASRLDLEILTKILTPLKKAVDIQAVWMSRDWRRYVMLMFAEACNTTWKNRCRYMDGINDARADKLQAYANIRAAPDQLCANRPVLALVPTTSPIPLDVGHHVFQQSDQPAIEGNE